VNRIYQAFGFVAIVVIAIVFLINFQPAAGREAPKGPGCAATVHGECAKEQHFWATYRLLTMRMPDEASIKAQRIRETTMDGLIERQLLLSEAKRLGITVGEEDVNSELASGRIHVSFPAARMMSAMQSLRVAPGGTVYVPFTDKSGKPSIEMYKRRVSDITHLSEVEFREYQKEEITAARVRDLIRSRAQISESEVKEDFMRRKSTTQVKYVKFERRYFADNVLDTSDKAIDAWANDKDNKDQVDKVFESRKASYGECRLARHILIKVDDSNPAETENNKKKAKEKIDAAKKRLDKEAFEDVARDVSEDTSAKEGGDLGCVVKGTMVKPFETALFALAKDGDVSDVVETQFGYHIIQVVSIKKGKDAEEIGRHNTAKDLYLGQESDRLANKGAKEVLDAVKGGKSMEDALKDYLAKLPKKPAPEKKADKQGDAKKDDKKDDKKSDAKKDDKKDDKKPAEKGDAKKDVKKDGDAKKDDKKSDDQKADDEKKDADAPPENLPTVETSVPFNESGVPFDGASSEVDPASLAMALKNPGDAVSDLIPLEQGTGYAIMQLKEKKPASDEEWAKNRDIALASARVFKQQDALSSYMKRLRAEAKADIKPNNEFLIDPADKAKAGASGSAVPFDPGPPQE